jgi:hypothetical protein
MHRVCGEGAPMVSFLRTQIGSDSGVPYLVGVALLVFVYALAAPIE